MGNDTHLYSCAVPPQAQQQRLRVLVVGGPQREQLPAQLPLREQTHVLVAGEERRVQVAQNGALGERQRLITGDM